MLDQFNKHSKRLKKNEDHSMPNFQQNVMNRTTLSMLEIQDFKKQINVFYKDACFPRMSLQKLVPPQHLCSGPVKKGLNSDQTFNTAYRNFLINFKESYKAASGGQQ